MSSRNKILADLASARYPDVAHPGDMVTVTLPQNLLHSFLEACHRNGTDIIQVNDRNAATEACRSNMNQDTGLSTLLVESSLGVAENGSVWLTEEILPDRVAPFACEHLCVILSEKDLVPTMHHAYQRLTQKIEGNSTQPISGFGVFIAGPSKTADIEQTLVTGAQGSKKHTIFLITSL